jgi:hypothetical protein
MALSGDHVLVLVDGYDLTADHNRINVEDARAMYAAVSFGDAVKKSIPGQRQMRLTHTGYMNAAAAQSHPVLKGVAIDGVVSVLVGQNAAPTFGDPIYCLLTQQSRYRALPQINQVIPFNADFANRGNLGGWGVALAVPTTFTNTTNGSTHNNGAATTSGGAAFLHLLQVAATDTYSIIVQGSTTGAFGGEETTIATFTLNASALDSERIAIAGTVPRYTRWRAVRTGSAGDTVKIAVALLRF